MTQVELKTMPGFKIDAEKIAEGIFEMFGAGEKTALQFGMLPAYKMESLRRMLRERFAAFAHFYDEDLTPNKCFAVLRPKGEEPRFVDFDMRELVNEAMKLVTLELYNIGDLVV